jgi:hypothetical protein
MDRAKKKNCKTVLAKGAAAEVPAADPLRLQEWVEYLAGDIGIRPQLRPDILDRVADRLSEQFQDLGYDVVLQPVPYGTLAAVNVIACRRGAGAGNRSNRLLVVGAHYDTVSRSPGADDNGSGVAGLMELARLFAADPPACLLLFRIKVQSIPNFSLIGQKRWQNKYGQINLFHISKIIPRSGLLISESRC